MKSKPPPPAPPPPPIVPREPWPAHPAACLIAALYAARDRHPIGTLGHRALDAAALRVGRCPSADQLDADWLDPVRRAAIRWAPTDLDLREWIGKALTPPVTRATVSA